MIFQKKQYCGGSEKISGEGREEKINCQGQKMFREVKNIYGIIHLSEFIGFTKPKIT